MDCVNHSGVTATAYCQNCGKALCPNCARTTVSGQILCEPCWTAWQTIAPPFVVPPHGAPSPSAAAVLGLIPGVGAMYNGQFFKGLIHVVIFAVLISVTHHYHIFGIFIAAWILYQSFEAYHTAKARRDGEPLPDPLGLNELGNWFHLGMQNEYKRQQTPSAQAPPGTPGPPYPGSEAQGAYQQPYQPPYPAPYSTSYQGPFAPPVAGFTHPGVPPAPPVPPIPPVPPLHWRRREPIGAIVLIGLGLLFLLAQMDVLSGRIFEYMWPLMLIGLGVWLIARRLGDTPGGPK